MLAKTYTYVHEVNMKATAHRKREPLLPAEDGVGLATNAADAVCMETDEEIEMDRREQYQLHRRSEEDWS